jgi:ankyrin repeat protein
MAALLTRHGAADAPVEPKTAFVMACRKLDYAEVRRLAAAHPECLRDAEAILYAAHLDQRELVELLLDLGTDVDVEDSNGIRALGAATRSGALEVMKLLLERGADVDRPGKHYDGPLGAAAFFNQRAAAELLAPRSRDVHNLVFLEMKDRLRELFAAEPALVNRAHFRSGLTPLFTLPPNEPAALGVAGFLLEHGADPNFRDKSGDTPADAARRRGLEALAALLSRARR